MVLFSLQTYQLHQKRAQRTFQNHRFLFDHVASDLRDRMGNLKGEFNKVLDLSPFPSCHPRSLSCHPREGGDPEKSITKKDFICVKTTKDGFSEKNLLDPRLRGDDMKGRDDKKQGVFELVHHHSLPSHILPFSDHSFDLVESCLLAHWVNDIPQFLSEIRRCLRPGGLFLGALWGGNTLHELRESLISAELKLKGGASPRVAPMLQPADAPHLLGQAGFSMPVVDTETLTVNYPSLFTLMRDLRGMGETNKIQDRQKNFTTPSLFEKTEEIYRNSFTSSKTKILATFEIIYLTGWKN